MRKAGYPEAPPVERLSDWVPLGELPDQVDDRPVLGLSGVSLRPIGFDPRGTFTVAGPPGSGRTTALMTLVASVCRWRPDSRLVYFGSRRSPLSTRFPWERAALDQQQAAALAPDLVAWLGEAEEGSAPGVVVIEGLADFVTGAADCAMQDMVKGIVANGHLVISDGEPNVLAGSFPLLVAARSSRAGIVLQPEQTDATLFRSQFPRIRRTEYPPGRGLAVLRGQQPQVVQVAVPEGEYSPLSRHNGTFSLSTESNTNTTTEGINNQ